MDIELKRGKTLDGRTECYFIGMEGYDEFDWFLHFLVNRTDTMLINKVDGIYSRIAKFKSKDIYYEVIHHDDIGWYSHLLQEENDKNLSLLEEILGELTDTIKEL